MWESVGKVIDEPKSLPGWCILKTAKILNTHKLYAVNFFLYSICTMKFVVIDLITPTIYMHKIKSMHSYSNLQNVRHSVFHHTMSITCTLSLLVFASMNMVAFLSD